MKTYKIKVTRQARDQLRSIRNYIAINLNEPGIAKNNIKMLYAAMSKLADMPERFKVVDEEPWHSYKFRKKISGNYFIYFWINDETQQVIILAVIYARMDQNLQLGKITLTDS